MGEFVLAKRTGRWKRDVGRKNERFYNRREAARIDDEEKDHRNRRFEEERGDFGECLGAPRKIREKTRGGNATSRIDVNCLKRCKINPEDVRTGGVDRCLNREEETVDEVKATRRVETKKKMMRTRTAKFTFDATTRVPRDADAAIENSRGW